MTKILADGNNAVQKRQIYEDNAQSAADAGILDAEQLELSKYVNAEFYTAEVQVPNAYVETLDSNGNKINEPVWDHSNPKFAEFDMVRVQVPNAASGTPTIVDHYVTQFHIKRWPDRWKAYKQGRTIGADGTPIEQLTSIPRSAHDKLKEVGIFTIEQLAKAPDAGNLILQGNMFQGIARKYLEGSQSNKAAELETEVAELKAQLAELLAATKKTATKQ